MLSKITLGLPTYKGSDHIRESLDSILNQSFVDFELVISINGNDEVTFDICKEYARIDSRITVIYQRKYLNVWENWLATFEYCNSELFMWVADDDILECNYLENLYKLFNQHQGQSLIYGKFVEFEEFPIPTNHKANNIIFSFKGNKYKRKLKYLLMDPGYGKVNALYGLGRPDWFRYVFDRNKQKDKIFDVGFLFDMLSVCEIRFSDNNHYRRKFNRDKNEIVWQWRNVFFIYDSITFCKTIRNSVFILRVLYYVFLPYIIIRSFIRRFSKNI
jgi:glycosyltransferase involved in cell wall biosynthesis